MWYTVVFICEWTHITKTYKLVKVDILPLLLSSSISTIFQISLQMFFLNIFLCPDPVLICCFSICLSSSKSFPFPGFPPPSQFPSCFCSSWALGTDIFFFFVCLNNDIISKNCWRGKGLRALSGFDNPCLPHSSLTLSLSLDRFWLQLHIFSRTVVRGHYGLIMGFSWDSPCKNTAGEMQRKEEDAESILASLLVFCPDLPLSCPPFGHVSSLLVDFITHFPPLFTLILSLFLYLSVVLSEQGGSN